MIPPIENTALKKWIKEIADLTQPKNIHLCDGSEQEYQKLCNLLVESGTFIKLNPSLRPNSFLARSNPKDVARIEGRTFICSKNKEDAGPTNNWCQPDIMRAELKLLFSGCMQGRTLYVIPYSMGPIDSPLSHIGIEITDSPYVVCNMRIMTRIGKEVLDRVKGNNFVPCVHSVGVPLEPHQRDVSWPCNPEKTRIVHFPETKEIWSFGSGYGGNALLGKKCFALRIASVLAKEQEWLAEHMLIVGITNPEGKKRYFAAAFPSACGKTNLAMMSSKLKGWKVECVGDDIAWMRFGKDGQMYAINPEAGFFGVAPGTSMESNPNALLTCSKNSIFTNVALTKEGDVWWEGMSKEPPEGSTSWLGQPCSREQGPAAHPNSRFTAPASQCPVIDPNWENPSGVPISAIIFGGRRAAVVPLVYESLDWDAGVYIGCSVSSETTAAASGDVGTLRHDPFAMLPFCGYNMGDYFDHWLSQGKRLQLPRIYSVNWFKKSSEGKYLWPGFGENARVLKWIFERCEGKGKAEETAIGYLPAKGALDLSNLEISSQAMDELLHIDKEAYLAEVQGMRTYLSQFGARLPKGIQDQLQKLESRLQ